MDKKAVRQEEKWLVLSLINTILQSRYAWMDCLLRSDVYQQTSQPEYQYGLV